MTADERRANALDLMTRKRELLVGDLVGHLIDFGEAEFLDALQQAMRDVEQWRQENPQSERAVPMMLKLRAIAEASVDVKAGICAEPSPDIVTGYWCLRCGWPVAKHAGDLREQG